MINDVQKSLLQAVVHLDEFCTANDIEYYLTGGSLLGAIRHDGFIPWDTDIDVVMTRQNYNRFLSLYKNGNKYFLQNNKSDKFCPVFFSRLTLNNTTMCLKKSYNESYNMSLYIDIFPLDSVSNPNSIVSKIFERIIKFLKRLKYFKNNNRSTKRKMNYHILAVCTSLLTHRMKVVEKLIKSLIFLNQGYNSNYYTNYYGSYSMFRETHKKYLFKSIRHNFEGYELSIPNGYDDILKKLYGNYMELPPLSERKIINVKDYVIKI